MAIQWDTSWNQSRRATTEGALERITRMLTRAYISIQAVPRDSEARNRYVQHFSDPTLTYLAHVKTIVAAMHDRIATTQVVEMSYVPNLPAFTALGVGPLPPGVVIDQVEAFVTQNAVPALTPLTVYIAPAFFTGNVYLPNAQNQRTGTGTILHELSHGVGGTADHAYTWDPAYAGLTAAQRSANADSYRAYCQSFDA